MIFLFVKDNLYLKLKNDDKIKKTITMQYLHYN